MGGDQTDLTENRIPRCVLCIITLVLAIIRSLLVDISAAGEVGAVGVFS